MIFDLIYLFIVGLLLLIIIPRYENKGFMGLMTFWLLTSPVLGRPEYVITVPLGGFSFDLQPNRLLLIILIVAFILRYTNQTMRKVSIAKPNNGLPKRYWFDFALFFYICITGVMVLVYSEEHGSLSRAIALATNPFAFLLVYLMARKYFTVPDFKILTRVITALAIFSAIVGVIQFFVNPDFFHSGVQRPAFGEYIRANGVFYYEYDQGLFMIVALTLVFYSQHNRFWKIFVLMICAIGITVTFHRLSWIIFIGVVVFYALGTVRYNRFLLPGIFLLVVLILPVAFLIPWQEFFSSESGEDFLTERLQSDTLTVRGDYNKLAFYLIAKYPIGIGSFQSELYQLEAFRFGIIGNTPYWLEDPQVAPVVHNGILAAGVKGGWFGMLNYSAFFLGIVIFFGKRAIGRRESLTPFLVVMTYTIYTTTTQDFSELSAQIAIFWGLLLGHYLGQPVEQLQTKTVTLPATVSRQAFHGRSSL